MNKLMLTLTTGLLLSLLCSCADLKLVSAYKADSVEVHDTTLVTYFWGIKARTDVPARCDSKAICQVKTTVRPGHVILAVFTLGMVIPQHIEWYCCPPPVNDNIVN
jgi:hypothetical protein